MNRTPMTPVAGLSRAAALPPPSPRTRRPSATPADQVSRPRSEIAPSKATPSRSAEPGASRRRGAQAVTMRAVTLSLPATLIQDVRARARRDGISQPEVLMDALVATVDRLPGLLAQGSGQSQARSDGLFLRTVSGPSAAGEPLGTLTLRMLGPNVDAIDNLVSEHGAVSRSALCATALREYLRSNSP